MENILTNFVGDVALEDAAEMLADAAAFTKYLLNQANEGAVVTANQWEVADAALGNALTFYWRATGTAVKELS
jgi:hypothetical protein